MKHARSLLANGPPLLMLQGDKDTAIPAAHARDMKERADAVKAPVEIVIVQNSGHNWREEGGPLKPSRAEIVAKTAAFMKQHLSKAPRYETPRSRFPHHAAQAGADGRTK